MIVKERQKKDIFLYSYVGAPQKIDIPTALEYVQTGWISAPRTVMKGLNKIVRTPLPGQRVELKDIKVSLEEMLATSIKTLDGSQCSVMFSGGFDSMLMVTMARRFCAQVTGISVQFDGYNSTTIEGAVILAQRLGLPHHIIQISLKEFLLSFAKVAQLTKEPLLDLELALVYAAFKKYQPSIAGNVFISGMGSDQWFGDYALKKNRQILQKRLDKMILNTSAHHDVANTHGYKFIFPFLSEAMVALSLKLTTSMKKDKQLLRSLVDNTDLIPAQGAEREVQIPDPVRRILIKTYGSRAWPRPIMLKEYEPVDDRLLRQIVLGLWLERIKKK